MTWKKIKLENCCTSITDGDHQAPPKSDDGVPFITIANIDSFNDIDFSDAMHVPQSYYDSLDKKRKPQKGDIIYSVVGSFGIPVLIRTNNAFTFQRHIAILKCKNEVNSKFLYYQMKSRNFYKQADSVAIGSAQRTVTLSALKNMIVSVPSKDEQDQIATILSAYDDLIENHRRQIRLLEEGAERLYKEWFVRFHYPGASSNGEVPKNWKWLRLQEIAEICYGRDYKGLDEGKVPVYGSGGFMTSVNKVLYEGESVLVPRKGSLNNILYVNEPFWTVDTMFYSVMKIKNIAKYLYFYLKQYDMYSMNIGAAVPSMTTAILNSLDILVPDKVTLQSFDDLVSVNFKNIAILKKQITLLQEARDRLLPKLMSGEVKV